MCKIVKIWNYVTDDTEKPLELLLLTEILMNYACILKQSNRIVKRRQLEKIDLSGWLVIHDTSRIVVPSWIKPKFINVIATGAKLL